MINDDMDIWILIPLKYITTNVYQITIKMHLIMYTPLCLNENIVKKERNHTQTLNLNNNPIIRFVLIFISV